MPAKAYAATTTSAVVSSSPDTAVVTSAALQLSARAAGSRLTFLTMRLPVPKLPNGASIAVSTATAASASGGLLDAALVQITGANIADTATVSPDFVIHASDGSGALTIVIDPTLNLPRTVFRPGFSLSARGVLVPNGAGAWVLKPRNGGDIVLN